MSISVSCNVDL